MTKWYKYIKIGEDDAFCLKGQIVSVCFRNDIFEDRITHIKIGEVVNQYQSPQIWFYDNFISLAKWREQQINSILND